MPKQFWDNMKCDCGVTIDSKSENRSDQTIRWLLVSIAGMLIKLIYLGIHCVRLRVLEDRGMIQPAFQ